MCDHSSIKLYSFNLYNFIFLENSFCRQNRSPLEVVHILIPGTCADVVVYHKWVFADVIKSQILDAEVILGYLIIRVLKNGRGRQACRS